MSSIRYTISVLSLAFGILSLVILAQKGATLGLATPLQELILFYQKIIDTFLGWADRPLADAINYLRNLSGFDLAFSPDWKHIFILLWLYFSADFRMNLQAGRTSFAVFSLISGFLVAVFSGIFAGSAGFTVARVNALAVMIPIFGIIIFETLRCIWSTTLSIPDTTSSVGRYARLWGARFSHRILVYLLPVVALAVLTLLAAKFLSNRTLAEEMVNPNLFLLAAVIVALAIFWIIRGLWISAINREQSTMMHVGSLMLSVILGVVIFLGLNAGLVSVGL